MEFMAGRWMLCLSVLAILCIAVYGRNTIPFSGGIIEEEMGVVLEKNEGRSLKVRLDDYGEATANHGHDPKSKGSGRKGL